MSSLLIAHPEFAREKQVQVLKPRSRNWIVNSNVTQVTPPFFYKTIHPGSEGPGQHGGR
jgi:hypothetical protein